MKARRQAVILELIDGDPLHSQEVLRRRLKQRGFTATQATRASYASGRNRFRSRLVSESIETGSRRFGTPFLSVAMRLRTGL